MFDQITMPKRVYVTLPDTVHEKLERWAEKRGQALATAAAVAIELYMLTAEDKGEIPPAEKATNSGK